MATGASVSARIVEESDAVESASEVGVAEASTGMPLLGAINVDEPAMIVAPAGMVPLTVWLAARLTSWNTVFV